MKNLIFVGAWLLALSSGPVYAQPGAVETVVVTVENYLSLRLVISRGPGHSTVVEVPLKELRQNPTAGQETLQREFNKLFQEGFTLQGTYGGGATDRGGSYVEHSTLIFSKRH